MNRSHISLVALALAVSMFATASALTTLLRSGRVAPDSASQGSSSVHVHAVMRAQLGRPGSVAVPQRVYRRALQLARTHQAARPKHAFRRDATSVTLFVTDYGAQIWELNSKNTVVGALTDCSGPEGAKVDAYGNLWVACTGTGSINMYPPGASSASMVLDDTACTSPSSCATYYVADVALDPFGNVYATNLGGVSCPTSSCVTVPGNAVYWTANNLTNGARPSGVINDPNLDNSAYFIDTDALGTVYADYLGACASCSAGLDQVINPQSASATVNTVIAPSSGQLSFPGGVYASGAQTQLNVLDQYSNLITEFPIVAGTVESATGSLGAVPACDPVSMGWNQLDAQVAVADAGCGSEASFSLGTVANNTWKPEANPNFILPIDAAYSTSDKFQPDFVGKAHAAVMQAFIENLSTIENMVGPSAGGPEILEAMLQVPQIPDDTKSLITQMLLIPTPTLSSVCQNAVTQFESGFPQSNKKNIPQILAYMKSELSLQTGCPQFNAGVQSAISVVQDGSSTIYNPKWLKSNTNALRGHSDFKLNWPWKRIKKVLVADGTGAAAGSVFGTWGAAVGAVLYSLVEVEVTK